jgi:hypothetical protein
MRQLIERLNRFTKIVVTGPQRSGTTIATKILATELGYEFLREETFHIHRLDLLCDIIMKRDRFVVQAPTMSGCCHYFTGVAVVFMRRKIGEILFSERRVNWFRSDFEKAKYFDDTNRSSAEVKYDAWDRFQKRMLQGRGFDLEYDALRGHPLWVPQKERSEFSRRQIERHSVPSGGARE